MSFFSKLKHAFKHLGHDIEKVAKGVAHGVSNVAKKIEKDVEHLAKDALAMTDALVHGRMKEALKDLLNVRDDLVKTAGDIATAAPEAGLDSLKNMHLSKDLDKLADKIEKGFETVKKDINKGVDAAVDDIIHSAEGMVTNSIAAVKDLARGDLRGALHDLGNVAASGAELAADLTPEGLGANVAASTLSSMHIGNAQVDNMVLGALHGNPGGMIKSFAKNAAVNTGEAVANKALGGGPVDPATLALASLPAGGGGRHGHRGEGGYHAGGDSPAARGKGGPSESKPAHGPKNDDSLKSEKNGKTRKKDKKDDSQDNGNDNQSNNSTQPNFAILMAGPSSGNVADIVDDGKRPQMSMKVA